MSTRNTTEGHLLTPPVYDGNRSEACNSASMHLIGQAQEPQMTINQSDAGTSNSKQVTLEEHQIEDNNSKSPLSSSPERDLNREELLIKINRYSSWIREYAGRRTDKAKGKKKVCINSSLRSNQKKVSRLHQRILERMLMIMERCNAKGFVYGMVTENSKAVIGASDSLRAWWKRQIMFDKVGPAQTDLYYKENSLSTNESEDNEAKSTTELLMELSDTTLGSLLSLLMQNCDPPQKKFPFGKGMRPPWWPTANEKWWEQTGISIDKGPPPYRKPHDLRKKWKVAVLIALIKQMSPYYLTIFNHVKKSNHLNLRMNAKESKFWTLALVAEAKRYCQEHPLMPLDEPIAFLRAYGGRVSHNVRRRNVTIFANKAARFDNSVGFTQRPLFVPPPSSTTSAWAITTPPMGQLQQGVQNLQIAPAYLPRASSYNPILPSNLPVEVQQNHTVVGAFGASSSERHDHQSRVIQHLPFGAQSGGASTSGTPDS